MSKSIRKIYTAEIPRRPRKLAYGALIYFSFLAYALPVAADNQVTVFAAASLTSALDAMSSKRGTPRCRCVYASSSVLARQIIAGAPADIFISAHPRWMAELVRHGVIVAPSRRDLLRNRLVFAAPASAPIKIDGRQSIISAVKNGWLAMGDPDHVPAGIYGKAALENMELWKILTPRIVRATNVRAALALVERGEAALGLVYESDLKASSKVVLAGRLATSTHPPVIYSAAVIKGRGTALVKRFYDTLNSPEAKSIFVKHGFRPVDGP